MDDAVRAQIADQLASLPPDQLEAMHRRYEWLQTARPDQLPPEDYFVWLLMAGRGAGKTRSGAEDVWWDAYTRDIRVAVLGPTLPDIRKTAFEGESGLLARIPSSLILNYNRTSLELWTRTISGGSSYYVGYSAEEPERLRGPQHHIAWCLVGETMVDTPAGPRRIDSIIPGDLVCTRVGPRVVTHVSSRPAEVRTVNMVGPNLHPTMLCGSLNHPVLTRRGWVPLGDLEVGECVIGASLTRVKSGTSTVMGIMRDALGGSTGSFGGTRLVKYLKGMRSTTKIATSTITQLKTWIASASLSIADSTVLRKGLSLCEQTGPRSLYGRSGVQTAELLYSGRSLETQSVDDARCVEQTKSARQRKSAGTVGHSSSREVETTVLSVVSITEPEGTARIVYDLRVEEAHEFIANGVVVHNCDELGAWNPKKAQDVWDNLLFGLRLGQNPRIVVTTTPRTTPLLRNIVKDPTTRISRASTFANKHLPESILRKFREKYEGTRLGRQELEAELLEDVVGALWVDEDILHTDVDYDWEQDDIARIVVAVDPSGSSGDSIGIVVAGLRVDGSYVVLADRTIDGSPAEWGRAAVAAYEDFGADRLVAEVNFGGAMVEAVIRNTSEDVSYQEVRASRGKIVRAEPIAALYEQHKVTHVRGLVELEKQMMLMTNEGYVGDGSPDRVDALVWALTALSKKRSRKETSLAVDGERKAA